MYFLALDQSTTNIGWCVGRNGDVVASSVQNLEAKGADWVDRVYAYRIWLENSLARGDFDAVLYEIPTGDHKNKKTDRMLGAVEYITLSVCREWQIPIYGVTASQVRATKCHKKALQNASAVAGHPVTSSDEADAIGVFLAGLALADVQKAMLKERIENE